MVTDIDHIAVAVADLEEEIKRYRDILGLEYCGTEEVAEQKVRVAFFRVGATFIELLEPTSPDSPIAQFIEKRGGGLHHIALAVDDIRGTLGELKGRGVRLLSDEPASGAHHSRIAFAHPKSFSGVLLEFKQREPARE